MIVAELLSLVDKIAKDNELSQPYIVGGIPRAVISKNELFNDIDITTGSDDIFELSKLVADKLNCKLKHLNSGGYRIMVGDICLDFSSNFFYENIDELLAKKNLPKTALVRETLSRDFTANTLLMPTNNLTQIIDISGQGIKDIEDKVLRCPLDMDQCFKSVPSRMLRALHMHICKGYGLSDEMLANISLNAGLLKTVDAHYAGHLFNDIIKTNPDFLEILIELGIIHHLPLTKKVLKELVDRRGLIKIL